jgi:hypothetical protein
MIKMTFSEYCISGYLGNKCNCSRCREQRGLPITPESEELSKYQSLLYRSIGGTKDTIWNVLRKEFPDKKDMLTIAEKVNKEIIRHLETGNFKYE